MEGGGGSQGKVTGGEEKLNVMYLKLEESTAVCVFVFVYVRASC